MYGVLCTLVYWLLWCCGCGVVGGEGQRCTAACMCMENLLISVKRQARHLYGRTYADCCLGGIFLVQIGREKEEEGTHSGDVGARYNQRTMCSFESTCIQYERAVAGS